MLKLKRQNQSNARDLKKMQRTNQKCDEVRVERADVGDFGSVEVDGVRIGAILEQKPCTLEVAILNSRRCCV